MGGIEELKRALGSVIGLAQPADTTAHEVHDLARFALTLHYARPVAAARWLAAAFDFEAPNALPEGEDLLPGSDDEPPWDRISRWQLLTHDRPAGRPAGQSQPSDSHAVGVRGRPRGAPRPCP